jgi:hypothetical protein
MKKKYKKYWENIENNKNINFLMFVAFDLNLRSKMRVLVYWLTKCHRSKQLEDIGKLVKSLIKLLMDQYNIFNASESPTIQVNI